MPAKRAPIFVPVLLAAVGLAAAPSAFAAKAGAGGGDHGQWKKQSEEHVSGQQKRAEKYQGEAEAKQHREEVREEIRERKEQRSDDMSGKGGDDAATVRERSEQREEVRERKAEGSGTEAGKGSAQGQASREEHSRKWWRFWE